jgi:hypothetical protein
MSTPEIRRRTPSYQYDDHDEDGGGTIRVIPATSYVSPRNEGRSNSYRKAVPRLEEEEDDQVGVIRAGNIMMEQVAALRSQSHRDSVASFSSSAAATLRLSPSVTVEKRRSASSAAHAKAKWSDQPIDEEGEEEEEDFKSDSEIAYRGEAASSIEPYPTNDNVHLTPPMALDIQNNTTDWISSSSASSTLVSISRSLHWSQKFPHGRHLSRAMSRTTMKSKSVVSNDDLAEARAGLRLLARSREDVEDVELVETTRVAKWNRFKWSLFLSVLVVFLYGTLGLICSLLTWAEAWEGAEVSVLVDTDIVICEFERKAYSYKAP